MANPTTNYSFVLPTATDLVTDLPADFDVALQGVDTRLKALNPSTTLGDIEYASATANTNTRLAIGTTSQVLTVAGGVPSWATVSSGGMTLLSTTTLSGATTTISSISGSYNRLFGVIYGVTNATVDGSMNIRVNGSTTTHSYTRSNGAAIQTITANLWFLMNSNVANVTMADANNVWSFTIDNYASATNYKPISSNGTYNSGAQPAFSIGGYYANTAVTSLVFANSGGNLSTGTVLLYGVK